MAQQPASTLTDGDRPAGGPLGLLLRSVRKHGLMGSLRVLAMIGVVAALLFLSHPTLLAVSLGTPLVLLGLVWRAWASGHLLKSLELAVSGPYRHVQNPLYFGRLCILTGFGLMAWMPWTWDGHVLPVNVAVLALLLAVFFGYYIPRKKRVEGERLARLHGADYARWAAAVPLIIPSPRAYGTNVRRWTAERFHDNNEGWMVAMILLVTIAFWWKALQPAG